MVSTAACEWKKPILEGVGAYSPDTMSKKCSGSFPAPSQGESDIRNTARERFHHCGKNAPTERSNALMATDYLKCFGVRP